MNAHDMLDHPNTYRPGNGETTKEMIERVSGWLQERLAKGSGTIPSIAMIGHSGSITSSSLLQTWPTTRKVASCTLSCMALCCGEKP